jgi:outer membrane lipoprotein-sorting protein
LQSIVTGSASERPPIAVPLPTSQWDEDAAMSAWPWGCALLLVCASVTTSVAQGPNSWQATVRGPVPAEGAQPLTSRQVELVRQVNDYFNQLTMLHGSFDQTSADGKRQRGKFHIMRPARFRFDFAPPNRVVVISDGRYLAIQDYSLNTDDRKDLAQTPFRPLLQAKVDLLRDALISEATEAGDTITIGLDDASGEIGSLKLFLSSKPVMQLKGWITRDNQNLDTRVDLSDVQPLSAIDQRLFDPSSRLERNRW